MKTTNKLLDIGDAALTFYNSCLFPDISTLKLLSLNRNHRFHGRCTYPANGKGYRIRCSINPYMSYPYKLNAAISTWTKKLPTGGTHWGYDYQQESVTVFELLVYLMGHELFHYLRHSRRLNHDHNVVRNTEPSACRFGLWCLDAFRHLPNGRTVNFNDYKGDTKWTSLQTK